jgi:hypothetical protein
MYWRMQVVRVIPFTLVVGIIASILVITFWSFREWVRMMLQLTLSVTIAATFLGPMIKRFEEKLK